MNQNHMPPRLLVGPPGVGKTASIIAGYDYCEVVLLSSMTEEDISGLPYHDGPIENRTEPPLFRRLREASDKGLRTALFLDEIDKARREVADTLLTLVASRHVGEWKLPDGCEIWAAANPPEWGGGDGVSQAMMSRFSVIEYKPNLSQWLEWCERTFSTEENHAIHGIMHDIESGRAPLLECNGEGWKWRLTCPRTWELAIRGAMQASDHSARSQIVSGLLTPNAASALLAHFSKAQPVEAEARSVAQRAAAKKRSKTPFRIGEQS